MLDLGTILSVVSLILTVAIGMHISVNSNCFGFSTHIESRNGTLEIDIDYKDEELKVSIDETTGQTNVQIVDISNNKI